MTAKPYVVLGATGGQGGAVLAALLDAGRPVRAVVRSPDSVAAQRLVDRGVELAPADLFDSDGLAAAMSSAAAVFALTTPFEDGPQAEIAQGRAILQAAKAAHVPHLVFSSVASADRATGIPHFESKRLVELDLMASGLPYTIVGPTYFFDNLLGGDDVARGRIALAVPPQTPLQQLSRRDLGRFVVRVFADPDPHLGRRIDLASDEPTPQAMAAALSAVLGRTVGAEWYPASSIPSPDLRAMFGFLAETGYAVDLCGLRRDYPEVQWQSFRAWAEQTW